MADEKAQPNSFPEDDEVLDGFYEQSPEAGEEVEVVKEETTETIESAPKKTITAFSEPIKPERTKTVQAEVPVPKPPPVKLTPAPTPRPKQKPKKEEKNVDITEHLENIEEYAKRLNTNINLKKPGDSKGYESSYAADLLVKNGPNVLTPPKKKSALMRYFECLTSLFNLLLILAGILEYVLLAINFAQNFANTYLGAILIFVAFVNAFIEFYQAQKSQAILESFLNMIPAKCTAIRDGKINNISAADLVVGDVVFIHMGDKVPADVLIFWASDLKVDNSSLTGESEPQERFPSNTQKNPLEATNLVFNGTLAVSGEGYGIVVRTGDHTVLGQIAGLTAGEDKTTSPLSQEIDFFVKIIAVVAFVTAIIFFGIGLPVNRYNISNTLNFAIGVFVAWVPEGLPATVTILLTIAAKRMAKQNVLVKDLQGVETLGAITLLATDKTGTLTRNQMTVTNAWSCLTLYSALRNMQNADNVVKPDAPGLPEIMLISTLNSRARFDRTDVPFSERQILGDATETGLIRFAGQNMKDFDKLNELYPKVFEIPFNSDNKWAMTIHKKQHANGHLTLYIKGAPERVLKLCNTILVGNGSEIVPLKDEHTAEFNKTYELMAGKGHRVLAFAMLQLPGKQFPEDFKFTKDPKNYPDNNFTFVGLASLEDPPKHGVREAIGRCRSAGIKVIMVTGDHPLTAEAIGRKINLMLSDTQDLVAKRTNRPISDVGDDEYNAIVIHGEEIATLTDERWDFIFSKEEIIFARTSPKNKLEIVKRAQSMGHIVGVTGDGVNDSPALKKADLGIAMNESGSDVSKEAAAMILLDDNFASIIRGIEEGRLIFSNLKKSIQYTISHTVPEVIPNLLYVIVPVPLPLSAILVLVIDLGFELFVALTYAWDKPETSEGLMKLQPRKPVNNVTIERYRRNAVREAALVKYDEESGEDIHPTRSAMYRYRFGRIFTSEFWKERFESTQGEVLVDGTLLSWAYLEIGIIEAIGATVAFFVVLNAHGITPWDAVLLQRGNSDPTLNYFNKGAASYTTHAGLLLDDQEQLKALAEGQSIVYFSIMIMQMFNLFACKARLILPVSMYAFSNWKTFAGMAAGAALATIIVYAPPFNIAFGTAYTLSPLYWLIPMAFGVLIIIYATLRMLFLRKFAPAKLNPDIAGLQMYPTMRTVASLDRSKPK